jgi:hypothetical protein
VSRDPLHALIDRIPEGELPVAQRFLEFLASSPAYRAALCAPVDDEPVTEGDASAILNARAEIRAGKVVAHGEMLREFGLPGTHQ